MADELPPIFSARVTSLPVDPSWSIYEVVGSSMEPTIHAGDVLLCDPDSTPDEGDIVLIDEGEAALPTVWRFFTSEIGPLLEKDNRREFRDCLLLRERSRILGVVVRVARA